MAEYKSQPNKIGEIVMKNKIMAFLNENWFYLLLGFLLSWII